MIGSDRKEPNYPRVIEGKERPFCNTIQDVLKVIEKKIDSIKSLYMKSLVEEV